MTFHEALSHFIAIAPPQQRKDDEAVERAFNSTEESE